MDDYRDINATKLNEAYTEVLQGLRACDTLLFVAKLKTGGQSNQEAVLAALKKAVGKRQR